MIRLLFLLLVPALAQAGDPVLLTDFTEEGVAERWQTVNDGVMGGRSSGGPKFKETTLHFSGSTNTNGGGFSSIRTRPAEHDLGGLDGVMLRVKGDGRTYKLEMRTDVGFSRDGRVPYRADFATKAGEWIEVFVPFAKLSPSFRGMDISNRVKAFDPSKVTSVGLMIYDKKDGAFSLEVDWIKAVVAKEKATE